MQFQFSSKYLNALLLCYSPLPLYYTHKVLSVLIPGERLVFHIHLAKQSVLFDNHN